MYKADSETAFPQSSRFVSHWLTLPLSKVLDGTNRSASCSCYPPVEVSSIQIRYQKVKLNQAKQTESPHHLRSGCFSRLSSKKSYFLVVINKHAEKKVSMEREQQRQKTVNAVWAEDNI